MKKFSPEKVFEQWDQLIVKNRTYCN